MGIDSQYVVVSSYEQSLIREYPELYEAWTKYWRILNICRKHKEKQRSVSLFQPLITKNKKLKRKKIRRIEAKLFSLEQMAHRRYEDYQFLLKLYKDY